MTQTLTTEQLKNLSYSGGIVGDLARELLVNRESQPIVSIGEDELNAALQLHRLKVEGHSQLSDAFRAGFKYARRTAPPAPAVPEETDLDSARMAVGFNRYIQAGYVDGWNACRAAMLKGAK
ncbi:TPA: hypothetical protein ACKQD1_004304 [Serratia marcescens]